MKARLVILVIIPILLVGIGLGAYAWTVRPRLIEIYPPPGEVDISIASPIRLVFSRAMNPETVIERLKFIPSLSGSFRWEEKALIFTPDHPWPNGQEISLQLKAGARAVSWLAFPLEGQSWTFMTGSNQLAYLWPSDGPADLYALNPVTGKIHRFTHGMGILEYTASSDGIMIYFSAGNVDGGADIYRIDRTTEAAGAFEAYQLEKILACGPNQCRTPAISTDSMYLAYEYLTSSSEGGPAAAQIWLMNLATSERSGVGENASETVLPAWSTKGWLAYYDRTSQAYEVINQQTREQLQFLNQTGQPISWSPGGEHLLAPEISYAQTTPGVETGSSHLLRYRINGGGSEDLSGGDEVEDVEGIYSPDGKSIAFTRKYLDGVRWSPGRQIWIMNMDGSGQTQITDEADYNHYDLSWSRDGKLLAYVRFNQVKLSDPPELWMINADGSDPVQLVIQGYSPVWIP